MSSMLSSSDISGFTKNYSDFFETFQKDIVIYKQVKKAAINSNVSPLFGYDSSSNVTNYTNTITSGVFKGLISNSDNVNEDKKLNDINSYHKSATYVIKVEEDVKNFINNGETEKILIDNKYYNIVGSDKKVNFLSKNYYIYELMESV